MKLKILVVALYSVSHFFSGCTDTSLKLNKDEIHHELDRKLTVTKEHLVIKNVNLVSMESDVVMAGMDVYISDSKIEKCITTQATDPGYTEIDGTNRFLIPGLADMHVHFIDDPEYNRYNAFLFLANGITTVRLMWGVEGNIALRNKIKSGEILGPRMLVASGGFNGSVPLWPGTVITNSTEEVRSLVREFKTKGYDFIKIYSNIPKDQFDALIDESYKEGLKPIGHLPQQVDLAYAIRQKQYSIEHLGGFSKLTIGSEAFSEAVNASLTNNTWHCPTVIVQNRSSALVSRYEDEEYYKLISPGWKSWYTYPLAQPPTSNPTPGHLNRIEVLGELHQAGVNIISGTDMGIRYLYPGVSLHEELRYYVEAGFTPYEALKTSTKNVSLFLQDPTIGTIQVGNHADLVLLNANPLADIANIEAIEGIVVRGTWMARKDIDEIKALIRKLYQ
jgi:imidazolonepropionase-like amidohydrolase